MSLWIAVIPGVFRDGSAMHIVVGSNDATSSVTFSFAIVTLGSRRSHPE